MHANLDTCERARARVCVCVCACARVGLSACLDVRACVLVRVCVCLFSCLYSYIYACLMSFKLQCIRTSPTLNASTFHFNGICGAYEWQQTWLSLVKHPLRECILFVRRPSALQRAAQTMVRENTAAVHTLVTSHLAVQAALKTVPSFSGRRHWQQALQWNSGVTWHQT